MIHFITPTLLENENPSRIVESKFLFETQKEHLAVFQGKLIFQYVWMLCESVAVRSTS